MMDIKIEGLPIITPKFLALMYKQIVDKDTVTLFDSLFS
jgi:hypothetical protein